VIRYPVLFAAALLAGCASSTGSSSALAPTGSQSVIPPIQTLTQVQSRASPATCDKAVKMLFRKSASAFRVPPCAGWKGQIRYPTFPKPTWWTITSSVTDNFGAPTPPSGTAIFYMLMAIRKPVGWAFPSGDVTDTITGSELTSSHSYSLNVYNLVYNDQCPLSQCTWTLNIGSPQPGSHTIKFSSPLNGATITGDAAAVWQFVQN